MKATKSELEVAVPLTLDQGILSEEVAVGSGSWVAKVGHHPSYGNGYAGFWFGGTCWNCPDSDYSLLTDGANTFLNAPRNTSKIYFRGANQDWGYFQYNGFYVLGSAYKPGGGSWSATSDRRVKKDIAEFRPGLAAIEEIHPVTYRYNGLGET